MTGFLDPLPAELLTSWYARRNHKCGSASAVEVQAVLDRGGKWRHPDIKPTRSWLTAASAKFEVDETVLAGNSLARLRPGVPADFLTWAYSPFCEDCGGYKPAPRLAKAWCCRCLAEDFAAGRPAHTRMQWADAASSFCQEHRWPLFDHCPFCLSSRWHLVAPPRGPLRMLCMECWRPLDQTTPNAFVFAEEYHQQWNCVVDFEAELQAALRGKTPDQFRFNFTSARQLVDEVRDIAKLLLCVSANGNETSVGLNTYSSAAMRAYGNLRRFGRPVHRFSWRSPPRGCDAPCSERFALSSIKGAKRFSGSMGSMSHWHSLTSSTLPPVLRSTIALHNLDGGRHRLCAGLRQTSSSTGTTQAPANFAWRLRYCKTLLQDRLTQLARTAHSGRQSSINFNDLACATSRRTASGDHFKLPRGVGSRRSLDSHDAMSLSDESGWVRRRSATRRAPLVSIGSRGAGARMAGSA